MTDHKAIPFTELHQAKLRAGTLAARPGAAQGVGDAYLATDTGALYVCLSGTAWTQFTPNASQYSGVRNFLAAPITIAGTNVADYITMDSQSWMYGGAYGSPGALILFPVDGIFQYSASIKLENTAAGVWTFQVFSSDFDILTTHTLAADGSGDPLELNIAGELKPELIQPTTGAWFYINAAQDSGSDQDILAGSYVTLSKIGDFA